MTELEKQNIKENNLLLKVKSGSYLYGLNTKDSDEDYLGVVFEPIKFKLGFETFNELDFSKKDKLKNGRNSKDAIDEKYYSLTRFVELLFSNNPTILELLFSDLKDADDIIKKLYENRHYFLTKDKIINAFIGYAFSQEKKMEIKTDNLKEVENFYNRIKHIVLDGSSSVKDVLNREPELKDILEKYEAEQKDIHILRNKTNSKEEIKSLNDRMEKIFIGTRQFSVNMLYKKFVAQLEEILSNKSNRAVLVKKHGYDTKFASHYLRLLLEGIELLETGKITFPLKDREFLLGVKTGKYTMEEVIEFGKVYKDKLRNINSVISNKVNAKPIENLIIEFYKVKYNFDKN